jgi:hypothetical protein
LLFIVFHFNTLQLLYNRECGGTSGDVWITSPWGEQNLMMLKFDSVFRKEHKAEKGFSLRARTIDIGYYACFYVEKAQQKRKPYGDNKRDVHLF